MVLHGRASFSSTLSMLRSLYCPAGIKWFADSSHTNHDGNRMPRVDHLQEYQHPQVAHFNIFGGVSANHIAIAYYTFQSYTGNTI